VRIISVLVFFSFSWASYNIFFSFFGTSTGDHYYLNTAASYQLNRLRKEELVRLYLLTNASDSSTDHLTKHDLVDAILVARHDNLSLQSSSPHAGPPSSPSSTGAGDDETDGERLRPLNRLGSHSVARSFSLGCLTAKKFTRFEQFQKAPVTRRRTSNAASTSGSASRSHSSSTTQSRRSSPTAASSPLIIRLRTRTVSFHCGDSDAKRQAIKGKAQRQVESDEEDNDGVTEVLPSPKRLRTRNNSKESHEKRRITPMRKAKGRVGSLKESDEDELEDDDEQQEDDETEQDEGVEEEGDEELDELAPSVSPSPIPTRRRTRAQAHRSSPAAYDLRRSRTGPQLSTPRVDRGRQRRTRTQVCGTPSDGDDEDTDGEDHGNESDEETATAEEDTEGITMEMEAEPRKLRNGKIVGEDEEVGEVASEMDEDEQEGEVETGEDDGEGDVEDEDGDAASVDLEADSNMSASDASGSEASVEEAEEDAGEDDTEVDMDEGLQDATAKTLVRRRRDHLVRLCESRGIDAEGTKPQLVEALIQWVGIFAVFHG
jgi:mitogen-activated protein kinase kinase kinase 13